MMEGLTFMANDKMCIGIIKDEMMCRIDPAFARRMLGQTLPEYSVRKMEIFRSNF